MLATMVRGRARRGLRAVLVAVFVACLCSVTVATSGPASALDGAELLKMAPRVLGPTAAVGAEEVTAGLVCATGVGCLVLGAAAVGIGLYATQDVWVPWVQNAWGDLTANQSGPGGTAGVWEPILDEAVNTSPGGTASLTLDNTDPNNDTSTAGTVTVWCQQTQFNPDHGSAHVGDVIPEPHGFGKYMLKGEQWQYGVQCTGMGQIVKIQTSRNESDPTHATGNQVSWQSQAAVDATTYQATVNCVQDDGTSVSLSGPSTPNADGGVTVPSCAAAGLGSHAKDLTVKSSVGTGGTPSTVWASTPKADSSYPQCDPGAVSVCKFSVSYQGQECTVGAAGCADWARRSQSNPADYECLWGPYTLPLSSCSVQERAYETGTQTGVQATPANTDGDPSTATDVNGDPMEGGDPTPQDPPTGDPSPTATATPTPTISGPTDPRIPTEDQPEVNKCWPNGWSAFNPASWVLMPVRCALKEAFEPSPDVLTDVKTQLTTDLAETGPGPLITAIGHPVSELGGEGGGCAGPTMHLDIGAVHQDLSLFNACAPPMSTVAGYVKALLTMVIVVGGGLAVARAVAMGFGFEFRMRAGNGETSS